MSDSIPIPRSLAIETLELLADYLDDSGPCEHEANICVCGLGRAVEELHEAVYGRGNRCSVCRARLTAEGAEFCGPCATSEEP